MGQLVSIAQPHEQISLMLQRAAATVAGAIGSEYILLIFLSGAASERFTAQHGGSDANPAALAALLESIARGEGASAASDLRAGTDCAPLTAPSRTLAPLPALEMIRISRGHLECTAYLPPTELLQAQGLQAGLFASLTCNGGQLAVFAGYTAAGDACGEAEALRACEILDIAAASAAHMASQHHPATRLHRVVEAKQQYESAIDAIPQLVALLDEQGHVIRTNLTLEKWGLGKVDAIQGAGIHDMLHPRCRDWACRLRTMCEHLWKQLLEGNPAEQEYHDAQPDRHLRLDLSSHPGSRYRTDHGKQPFATLLVEDISCQKLAERVLQNYSEELEQRLHERTLDLARANTVLKETIQDQQRDAEALRESEKRYTCLVEATLMGIYVIQEDRLVFCNGRFSEIFGYPHEEICHMDLQQLFPGDGAGICADTGPAACAESSVTSRATDLVFDKEIVRGITSDGSVIWLQRTLTRVDCMDTPMIMGNIIDVTEQILMEGSLRSSRLDLERLSKKLINAQEEERKRIASELHDSVGQSISAVKFSVENALGEIGEQSLASGCTHLQNALGRLRDTMDEVRRISMDLRPSILDDLGLIATISWFCRDMHTLLPDVVFSKTIDVAEEEIPEPLKIVVFRILQEAINNAGKHAHARNIAVDLHRDGETLELLVDDDGQGFAVDTLQCTRGFGLGSMRERAGLSGGSLGIESACGAGTRIRARWTLDDAGVATG